MKDQLLLLSEFTNDEGFELNRYITHLFEQFSTLSINDNETIEPTS